MVLSLLVFALSFITTVLLTPSVRRMAVALGAVDRPGYRRVHAKPTPRLGGLAMFLPVAFILFLVRGWNTSTLGIILGSGVIVFLGVIDDIRGISPKVKLLGQFFGASIPVAYGIFFSWIVDPFGGAFYVDGLGAVFAILWIVGLVNTINITDGLDGLAAGITLIAAGCFFFLAIYWGQFGVSLLAIALVGSTLGFLQYNFSPAIIFMGDTGSMFLGYMLAVLVLESMAHRLSATEALVPLMVLGLPILDILFAVIRRRKNGQPIMGADRGHLHHRLLDLGLTTKQAVLLLYTLSASMGMLALAVTYFRWIGVGILAVVVGLVSFGLQRFNPKPQWLIRRYTLRKEGK